MSTIPAPSHTSWVPTPGAYRSGTPTVFVTTTPTTTASNNSSTPGARDEMSRAVMAPAVSSPIPERYASGLVDVISRRHRDVEADDHGDDE